LKILENWFFNVSQGKSKTRALREAKEKYLTQATSRKANPKYWANIYLSDHSENISIVKKKKVISNKKIIYFGLLIFIGLFVFKKFRH
jgi:hypothetical protein